MNKLTIFFLVFSLFWAVACVPTATTPPLAKSHKIRVVDAESGAPIAEAVVDIHYFPSAPEAPAANHPHAVANAQGEITLESLPRPALWQVQANRYVEQRFSSNEGNLPARYALTPTGGYDGAIHLYQLPEPQLTISVSHNYTGPLTINLQPAPGFDYVLVDQINKVFRAINAQASYIQETAGQRSFTATASLAGIVNLVATPLLYDLKASNLQVHDGVAVLPYYDMANSQAIERGVWGDINENDKQLYGQIRLFVGTRQAYQAFLSAR